VRKPAQHPTVITYRVETFVAYRRAVRVRAALGSLFVAVCVCIPSPLRTLIHSGSADSATAGLPSNAYAHVARYARRDRLAPIGVVASPPRLPAALHS
jgi:hypothetical protein